MGIEHPLKGKKFSDEHRKKLSLSHIGKDNHMKGKSRSEQTKLKISEKLKNRFTGKNSPHWKGGKIKVAGYYANLVQNKVYKYEHRLVAEAMLGRRLESDEIVHHKDGDKFNNNSENLQILTRSEHAKIHGLGTNIRKGWEI